MSQKFCNILQAYLLYYLSYIKSSLAFKVEVIVLHCLKPVFCYFFDPTLIPVLILQGEVVTPYSSKLQNWCLTP